jgi:hypothetical protein
MPVADFAASARDFIGAEGPCGTLLFPELIRPMFQHCHLTRDERELSLWLGYVERWRCLRALAGR